VQDLIRGLNNLGNCANCFHPKENHKPIDGAAADSYISHICNATIDCNCQHYEEPYLVDFAQEIEKAKYEITIVYDRCVYILQKIPKTRNASEKTFGKIYNEIWHGVKIRKTGSNLSTEVWDRAKPSDSINREKRRAKKKHPELQTYDPKVIKKQAALFEAYMELAAEA